MRVFRSPIARKHSSPAAETAAAAAAESWPAEGGVKATEFDAGVAERFFNRELEIKYFKRWIDRTPLQAIVLLGPQKCGKTVRSPFIFL